MDREREKEGEGQRQRGSSGTTEGKGERRSPEDSRRQIKLFARCSCIRDRRTVYACFCIMRNGKQLLFPLLLHPLRLRSFSPAALSLRLLSHAAAEVCGSFFSRGSRALAPVLPLPLRSLSLASLAHCGSAN